MQEKLPKNRQQCPICRESFPIETKVNHSLKN